MAYMNQERKRAITPIVKAILDQWGLKGRFKVEEGNTLVLTITEGKDMFRSADVEIRDRDSADPVVNVNVFHIDYTCKNEGFSEADESALNQIRRAMYTGAEKTGSEAMDEAHEQHLDYANPSWWIKIQIGKEKQAKPSPWGYKCREMFCLNNFSHPEVQFRK